MLSIPKPILSRILHLQLKIKPYKFQIVQELTVIHRENRIVFAEKFLEVCNNNSQKSYSLTRPIFTLIVCYQILIFEYGVVRIHIQS